jgi:hypothetical protein
MTPGYKDQSANKNRHLGRDYRKDAVAEASL